MIVLHSNEQGEVIDIISEEMVMVEVRGVKFPAYIDQLDFPYFKQFTEKKLFPKKKEKKLSQREIASLRQQFMSSSLNFE